MDQIIALLSELQFAVVDQETAVGELSGVPIAVTLLGADPPALMAQFRVDPAGSDTQPVLDLVEGMAEDEGTMSIEDGCVWLSLYNLAGVDQASIRLLLERIAGTIQSTDLAVEPGCLRCGGESAQLMCVEGRATRLCPGCLAEAAEERQELESELNRGSFRAMLGLPGAGVFVAAGWAGFWTLLDIVLEHWQIKVIHINALTGPLMLGLLAGLGYVLGWPAGATLRQSIASGRSRQIMSVLFVLGAVVAGEVLYIGVWLLRMAGVFDLGVAARLFGLIVANYTAFWIVCKLALLAAIGGFCVASASQRRIVRLDV